jgi:serine protease Do
MSRTAQRAERVRSTQYSVPSAKKPNLVSQSPVLCTGYCVLGTFALLAVSAFADGPDPAVLEAERQRIAVIERIKPAVVAVFLPTFQGGGSGVLIDPEGFALTNYHVVASAAHHLKCGLPDGQVYDAVLVGLDRVGDIALLKLMPKSPGQKFPFAPLGDSDQLRVGDWTLAIGNPFLLATDFQPTVTYGMVSGTHRYSPPLAVKGVRTEFTDCIQLDTSINPGNSGGPLFNLKGEVVGINGRATVGKPGRVSSGVGLAISINQVKNFLGHLRAGLDADHATLGAVFASDESDDDLPRITARQILEESDVARRGLQLGDELVSFAGRSVTSVNQYRNVLGIYPKEWRLPLVYRRNNQKTEVLVRLMGTNERPAEEEGGERPRLPPGLPPELMPRGPELPPPPKDLPYKKKDGFVNFHFNEVARDRLLTAFRSHGDFAGLGGAWVVEADALVQDDKTAAPANLRLSPPKEGPADNTVVQLQLKGLDYTLDPLKPGQDVKDLQVPFGSGGFMMALYHYRRLLTLGPSGFESFWHGGREPFYVWPADGSRPDDLMSLRADAEVLRTEHAGVPGRWYFSATDGTLLGAEVTVGPGDPCEVAFADYRVVDGRKLPHRIEVRHTEGRYAVFTVKRYALAGK